MARWQVAFATQPSIGAWHGTYNFGSRKEAQDFIARWRHDHPHTYLTLVRNGAPRGECDAEPWIKGCIVVAGLICIWAFSLSVWEALACAMLVGQALSHQEE